jgi:hypothetical protein
LTIFHGRVLKIPTSSFGVGLTSLENISWHLVELFVLEYWQFLCEYCVSAFARNVVCSHELCLSVSLTNNNRTDSDLEIYGFTIYSNSSGTVIQKFAVCTVAVSCMTQLYVFSFSFNEWW